MKKTLTVYLQNKKADHSLFVPYIMAGANGLDKLESEIQMLAANGADAIEVGIPFSDPVADGPIIQAAGIKSRKLGTTFKKIIQKLQEFQSPVPLILMGYTNSFFTYGLSQLSKDLANTQVKGVIIPDLPFEHRQLIKPTLDQADIALIQLVTLTSSEERVTELLTEAEGFVYAVTINGITGTDANYQDKLEHHLKKICQKADIAVLAGFGISNAEHVQQFNQLCDGVVIGSHIVASLSQSGVEETGRMLMELFSKIE